MFSVIVPTMWRSERTLPMLQKLNDCDYVSEIILIDNDTTATTDVSFEKLVYIPQLSTYT